MALTQYNSFTTLDAFGYNRTSTPYTLLDFKQSVDNLPLFFDQATVSGSGISFSYQTNKASTRITCSDSTSGHGVRQSKQWGNYQPGKSQRFLGTAAHMVSVPGITKRMGMFFENWGIFFQHKDGVPAIVVRTYNTGEAVDTVYPQSSWGIDKLDGNQGSAFEMDFDKTFIFHFDYEWLGVGTIRAGFIVNGLIYYVTAIHHANLNTEVYMSNPNAPVRYEIINDGTGPEDYIDTLCSTIISEGGQQQNSVSTYVSRNGTSITLAAQDIWTPVLSLRLRSDRRCTRTQLKDISVVCTTAVNFEWAVFLNPTVGGTDILPGDWTPVTNSSLEYSAVRTAANPLTGGYLVAGGYGSSSNQSKIPVIGSAETFLTIGSFIDGTMDEFVLGVKNIDASGGTCYGGLNLSEYC